jgi:formylglycine-generating enzyme required for sulfatase activity
VPAVPRRASCRSLFAAAAFAAFAAAACSGPNLASRMARPPEFAPKDQAKCGVTKSRARPLIVEWPSADRAALEAQARRGLVAVRYEGCDMEVLRHCQAPGRYRYTGITLKRDRVTMRDADELYANIPAYAAKFEGKLQTSGQLNVAMTIVGTYEAEQPAITRADLEGDCGGATHLVAGLTAGAFEFFAGADAEAAAGVEAFGAAAGGRSKSQRETLNQDGDDTACAKATSKDQEPPEGCGALLRVEVVPIAAQAPSGQRASSTSSPAPAAAPATPAAAPTGGQGGCPVDMVSVPGGAFAMGAREVTVAGYCMDLTEVTAGAYKACVDAGKCSAEGLSCGDVATYQAPGKANHPINCVNAAQAAAYCAAHDKRLPAEEEWEWAARGGARAFTYPWGDESPTGQLCWASSGKIETCPVGSTPRGDNPQGIHDLTGNVWEWTATGFGGKGGLRVIRGGGFGDANPELIASSKRVPNRPTDRNINLGFRCVKNL